MKNNKDTFILELNTSYEIKCESPEKFKGSVFRDVYRKVSDMVQEIVNRNRESGKNAGVRFNREEQFCNVIALLGGRGSGKSSALVSYCNFLANFRKISGGDAFEADEEVAELLRVGKENSLSFTVLDVIDATLLDGGREETIIEIVLARLLDAVEALEEEQGSRGYRGNDPDDRGRRLKTEIGDLYQYQRMKRKEEGELEAPVLVVKEKSKSWNLRSAFKKLSEDFNSYAESFRYERGCENRNNYIVIPVDDIDMNVDECWAMLEMIRKYLMVPRVLLMLTFNSKQLYTVCQNYYYKRVFADYHRATEEAETRSEELTRDYMEKVIPTGRRVYMPQLSQLEALIGRRVEILLGSRQGMDFAKLDGFKLNPVMMVEDYINTMLRCYTGVAFPAHSRNSYVFPPSLRKLCNYTREFLKLKSLVGGEITAEKAAENFQHNVAWLYQDVSNRFLEAYVEMWEAEPLREYLRAGAEEQKYFLLHELKKRSRDKQKWQEGQKPQEQFQHIVEKKIPTLGDQVMLLQLAKKYEWMTQDAIVCWQLLITIKKLQHELTGSSDDYLDGALWGDWDRLEWTLPAEGNVEAAGQVTRELSGDTPVGECDNESGVCALIRKYELVRIFFAREKQRGDGALTESASAEKEKFSVTEGKKYVLELKAQERWHFNLGNLFYFICHYKTVLQEVDEEIVSQFSAQEKEIQTTCFQLRSEMEEWEKKYRPGGTLPFTSVMFMERIQEMFYDGESKVSKNLGAEMIRLLKFVEEELRELDRSGSGQQISWKEMLNLGSGYYPAAEVFAACPVVKALRNPQGERQAKPGQEASHEPIDRRDIYATMEDILEQLLRGKGTTKTALE